MKHRGKKLKELTLTINQIVLAHKNTPKLIKFPIFRIELWLGNTVVDESSDIIAMYDRKKEELKLTVGSANFMYLQRQLFGGQKIARMVVKVIRSALVETNEELLDQFTIVLSQYGYEYCLSPRSIWQEHSVGKYFPGFLYYTVKCSYYHQETSSPRSQTPSLKKPTSMKKFSSYKFSDKSLDFEELLPYKKKSSWGYLPVNSLPDDDLLSDQTFVSRKKLQPVYRQTQKMDKNMTIRLEKSFISIEKSPQTDDSTISQTAEILRTLDRACFWLFYVYMCVSLWLFVGLLVPDAKV